MSLKLQKTLAAKVLKCGKRRVWLDPLEVGELSHANSRKMMKKLIKDGYVLRKHVTIHSKARIKKFMQLKN